MNLMQSLGLDAVETDPNALPDGKWDGVISKSEYVFHKAKGAGSDAPKDHISHVITYKVTEGDRKGAERQEWFLCAKVSKFGEDGSPESIEPCMEEQQKTWYKRRLMSLGVEEKEINTLNVESLKDLPITFGTKKNGNFININFVEVRTAPAAPQVDVKSSILGSL